MNTIPSPPAVALPEFDALMRAGTRLSNAAYNLAQLSKPTQAERNSLDRARMNWDDALAALRAQPSALRDSGVEGWKLVPVEPTKEMILAAEAAIENHRDSTWNSGGNGTDIHSYEWFTVGVEKSAWDAMIAAAPTPKLGEGDD